jgi:peptidyl-prolyl cis-trans isomerase C
MRHALRCFAAASLLLSIALGTSAIAEEKIVAVVDQQPLTEADMRLAEIEWGNAVANLSPADRRKTLLAFLIETQLLARAAVADNVLSKDEAASIERFNGRLGLRNAYFQRRVKERVTEADARKVYATQVKEIPLEEEVKARHILVDSEPRAAELRKQLAEGLSFAAAAQKFSQDPTTNVAGGDLGYSLKGQLLDEIDRTAFALKKGEVSEPVKSRFGWHLVLVEDRRTRQIPAFDQLKNAIMAALVERKAQDVLAELRKKAKIDIRDPALVAALAPAETGTAALPTIQAAAPAPISERPVRQPDGEFNTYGNGDLHGGDFRTLKNVEQKACRSACQASGECKGYSFDRWNGWCFLKSTVGSLIFDPSSISGVKTTQPEPTASDATVRIDRRPAKGYSGRHTRSNAVASFEQCEEACRSNKACVGYTYSKSAKVCKAFDQIENFGPEANAVSGYKTQTPQ